VNDFTDRARRIADEVLFPAAAAVDVSGRVPESHFELLAEEGYYGVVAPPEIGGAGLDLTQLVDIVEVFAGGCLATAFTWLHHHGVVLALADTDNTPLWAEYLGGLVSGRLRAGVAFAGALEQPPTLVATRVDGGFLLSGEVPMVAGWDSVDVLLVSASTQDTGVDAVVSGLLDAREVPGLAVDRLELVAAQGSNPVRLRFDDHLLPTERVTRQVLRREFTAGHWLVSRMNGALSLGIARRCVRLLAESGRPDLASGFGAQVADARTQLNLALERPDTMCLARAAAAELAYRVAGALVAASGSGSLSLSHHAQRLAREALFVLVTATRQDIRAGLVELFSRSPLARQRVGRPAGR
jgi:alkylation response protein AidB-like acyl-CoA dehydrogenase